MFGRFNFIQHFTWRMITWFMQVFTAILHYLVIDNVLNILFITPVQNK